MARLLRTAAACTPGRHAPHRDETGGRRASRQPAAPDTWPVGQRTTRRRAAEHPYRRACGDRPAVVGDHVPFSPPVAPPHPPGGNPPPPPRGGGGPGGGGWGP